MTEKKIVDQGVVLQNLVRAGLREQRLTEMAKALGVSKGKLSRILGRMLETGLAAKGEMGGYVMGRIIEEGTRRLNEDMAGMITKQQEMLNRIIPQPPTEPGPGELFLSMRMQGDTHKKLQVLDERMQRLEQAIRELNNQRARNERAIS